MRISFYLDTQEKPSVSFLSLHPQDQPVEHQVLPAEPAMVGEIVHEQHLYDSQCLLLNQVTQKRDVLVRILTNIYEYLSLIKNIKEGPRQNENVNPDASNRT